MSEVGEVVSGDSAGTAQRKFDGQHVYGSGGALKFEVARHQNHGARLVVMVDATRSRVARDFDWDNKVTMQLTANEAFMVFGVLMGLLPSYETAPHGGLVKKFRIEDQGRNWYVRVSDRSQSVAVPVTPMDAAQVVLLIARGLLGVHPYLGDFDGLARFAQHFLGRVTAKQGGDVPRAASASDGSRSGMGDVSQRNGSHPERRDSPAAEPEKSNSQQRAQSAPRGRASLPAASSPRGDSVTGDEGSLPHGQKSHPPEPARQAHQQQKFTVPATLTGIRQKTTVAELDRAQERVTATFSGEDRVKCLQAIEARRAEITSAMAG